MSDAISNSVFYHSQFVIVISFMRFNFNINFHYLFSKSFRASFSYRLLLRLSFSIRFTYPCQLRYLFCTLYLIPFIPYFSLTSYGFHRSSTITLHTSSRACPPHFFPAIIFHLHLLQPQNIIFVHMHHVIYSSLREKIPFFPVEVLSYL